MTGHARERLDALPALGFGHWPTPLDRLDRFSEAVGAEIWMKRDDLQGVAVAGNKARKFDLVVGRAVADGYDTLVTTGAIQSNSARTGAAAAAVAGMECVLILRGAEPEEPKGNLLLDHLLGAELRFAGDAGWSQLNALVDSVVSELAAAGRRAFAAPVGASSPLGSLGFARAYAELDEQLEAAGIEPSAIVHTTTSGGTHAGLLVGRALAGHAPGDRPVVGVDAGRLFSDPAAAHLELAQAAASEIDLELALNVDEVDIDDSQLGPGYGHPTTECVDAIRLLARTEGVICDPVYSGKGLAGLVARAHSAEGPLVFWHTGGYHALFDSHYGAMVL